MTGEKRRIRVHLTRLGRYYAILAVGIFLAAMVRQVNLLLLLAGLVTAPLFFSWFLARRNLSGIRVRRRLPPRASAGDLLVVEIEAERTVRYGQNWLITLTDRISRNGESISSLSADQSPSPRVAFFSLLHGQRQVAAYRGRLLDRGKYVFGPIRVSTCFPLGLLEAAMELPEERTILVYPRLGILNLPSLQRAHFNHEGKTRLERRSDRASGDFYGLKQWRPGDSPRLVHWRSSLRHRELLVKQFDRPRHRDVVIGLVLWVPDRPNDADLDYAEKAIRCAVTLIHDLCRQGSHHISLGVAGKKTEWISGPASPGFRDRALELLALTEVGSTDRPESFLAEIQRRTPPESEVIVVVSQTATPVLDGTSVVPEFGSNDLTPNNSPRQLGNVSFTRPKGRIGMYTAAAKEFDLFFLDSPSGDH